MSILINQLVELGCDLFCIAPGSRSTPLVTTIASNPQAKTMVSHDERSLGFFALGYAKATQKPVALVVTSGTAVANLFPAIIEASQDHVPLIILSADRPTELRGLGGNQTIDQVKLFGDSVRHFFDLAESMPETFVRTLSRDLFIKSLHPNPGPVHLNCQFREPFSTQTSALEPFKPESIAFGPQILSEHQLDYLTKRLRRAERGVVLAGAMKTRADQQAALQIIERLGWRAICDITSGLRFLEHPLLDHTRDFTNLETDCILQLGGRFILKPLHQWIAAQQGKTHIYVDPYLENQDPFLTVTDRVQCDLGWLADQIQIQRNGNSDPAPCPLPQGERDEAEPWLASTISKTNWENRVLFLGASLPIRNMDRYAQAGKYIPWVAANRGASGIDGIVSTAMGFALGSRKPLVLVVGDMTFLHDINGLSFLRHIPTQVVMIVVNNQGNGIFETLPIANSPEIFERYFKTSHHYCLEGASQIYAVKHQVAHTKQEFLTLYESALNSNKSSVIEFQCPTSEGSGHTNKTAT